MKRIRKIARPMICMARLLNAFLVQRAKSVTVVDTISATVIFYFLPPEGGLLRKTGLFPNISVHRRNVRPDLLRA